MSLSLLLLVPILLIFSGCETVARFEDPGNGNVMSGNFSSINFNGISSVDQKTDTTLRINWSAHADATAYDIYNTTSGSSVWLQTVTGQSSSNVTITGLNPNQLYQFRVRAKDSEGNTDGNTNDVSVTTNLAPDVPSGLTRTLPELSPGFSLPTIRISGVKNGDTIKLFSDSSCSTQVTSGIATSSTIDLTPSTLATGTINFYATATNALATASECSTVTTSFEKLNCPTTHGDYVAVPANPIVGTNSDFCVAKYEMKNVGGVATSQAALTPWASITQFQARTFCTDLGSDYGLINNKEWMTIAREIEMNSANWNSGVVGTGSINRGHSDNYPASALAVANSSDPYSGTANDKSYGSEQKRPHKIANGEIWDLSGNLYEWVDWNVTPTNKAYYSAAGSPQNAFIEWTLVDTNINSGNEMEAVSWQPTNPTLDNSNGIGRYHAGLNNQGGAVLRGGYRDNWNNAGIFTISLGSEAVSVWSGIGFRCVYRP